MPLWLLFFAHEGLHHVRINFTLRDKCHTAPKSKIHTDNISGSFHLIKWYRKRVSMQATFVLRIMILMVNNDWNSFNFFSNFQSFLSILTIKMLNQLWDKTKLNEMRQGYQWKIFFPNIFLCVKTHSRVMFSFQGEKLINFNLFVSSFMCVLLFSFCYAISDIKNCLVTFVAMVFLGSALLHFYSWTPEGCDRCRSFNDQNT